MLKIRSALRKVFEFVLKPFIILDNKIRIRHSKEVHNKCKNMTDQELIERFVQYIIWDMKKRKQLRGNTLYLVTGVGMEMMKPTR